MSNYASSRLFYLSYLFPVFCACGGRVPEDGSAAPSISVDSATCEAALETVLGVDGAMAGGIAIDENETVYFSRATPADARGVYAMGALGTPRRLSSDPYVPQIFVDGSDLLLVDLHSIRRLPVTGGASSPVVVLAPDATLSAAQVDATHIYYGQTTGDRFTLARVPRSGGASEVLLESAGTTYRPSSFVLGNDDVFIAGMDPGIFSIPKTGGSPTLVQDDASMSLLVTSGGFLYWDRPFGSLMRTTTTPGDPGAAIAWPSRSSLASYGDAPGNAVSDERGAYLSFQRFEGTAERWAFAPLPRESESVVARGCTPAADVVFPPVSMALSRDYIYAVMDDPNQTSSIVRVRRQ